MLASSLLSLALVLPTVTATAVVPPSPTGSAACELVRTDVRAVSPVYGAAAASDGDAVYFAGGDSPTSLRGDVLRYQPGARGVRELKVGITPRRYPSAAFFEGRLVVLGGTDRKRALDLVEAIDVDKETLTVLPQLSVPRVFAGAAVHDGALWVAGGELGGHATNTVEILEPGAKVWRAGPPLSVARATRLVVMERVLWALPGYDGARAVPVLERLEGDRWVRVDGAPAISAFAAAPLEGGVALFGDYREQDGVWVMDRAGHTARASTAQVARRHAAAATAHGQIVVFGGNRAPANASSVGVLEAFEARCVAVPADAGCDALIARAKQAFSAKDEAKERAALDEARTRCGVGHAVSLRLAMNHGRVRNEAAMIEDLFDEVSRPGAHPRAMQDVLKLTRGRAADDPVRARFAKLGRSHDEAISAAGVKGQRAWVETFACAGGRKPTNVVQALTRDQLDVWTFNCGSEPGTLWFDFETGPVDAFAPRVE